jgi:hypothetical protein
MGSDQDRRALLRRNVQVGQFQHGCNGLAHLIALHAVAAIEGRHRHIVFGKGHRHRAEPPFEGQPLQEPQDLLWVTRQEFRCWFTRELEALSLDRLSDSWREKVRHDPVAHRIRGVVFVPADQHFPRRSKMAFRATVLAQSAETSVVGIGVMPS